MRSFAINAFRTLFNAKDAELYAEVRRGKLKFRALPEELPCRASRTLSVQSITYWKANKTQKQVTAKGPAITCFWESHAKWRLVVGPAR